MNAQAKKLLRTVQVNFPQLLDAKFALMRRVRDLRGVPFDDDFRALGLFPDSDNNLFLDVGANRGQSTDAILLKTRKGRIQMFEPNSLLCEKLTRMFGDNPRVTINRFGLGDGNSESSLYVPFYKRWMFDGLASFDKEEATSWLRGRVYGYKESNLTVQEVNCKVRRLDELGLSPTFIKLDVQGFEFQVIKGGEKTIATYTPVLLVESPPKQEMVAFLKGLGYRMYSFKEESFFPDVIGDRNTFFLTPNKVELVRQHIR